jgi:lipopolysaccharide export system permease protein
MKLIDRYIAVSFVKNYLISFLVLVGMYVVLDMIFNFDELVEINARPDLTGMAALLNLLQYIADFYFYQMFQFFVHLSGIIPVVAASFSLVRMVRFNELSALLSAGVPLQRIAMPILIAGMGLNGLLWIDQEYIIPNIIPQLTRRHNYGASIDANAFQVSAMRDVVTGAKLFVGRYVPVPPDGRARMDYVSIVLVDEGNQPLAHIKADMGVWNKERRCWDLFTRTGPNQYKPGGTIDHNLSPHQNKPITSAPILTYPADPSQPAGITPEEIQLYHSGNFVELLSLKQIDSLLQRPGSYGRSNLLRVKYFRGVAQMTLNMILLILCVSTVLTREPGQMRLAAGKCIVWCGLCLSMAFAGQQFAGAFPSFLPATLADLWPALMAWMPVLVFGPISIVMLDRVKT